MGLIRQSHIKPIWFNSVRTRSKYINGAAMLYSERTYMVDMVWVDDDEAIYKPCGLNLVIPHINLSMVLPCSPRKIPYVIHNMGLIRQSHIKPIWLNSGRTRWKYINGAAMLYSERTYMVDMVWVDDDEAIHKPCGLNLVIPHINLSMVLACSPQKDPICYT